MNNRIIIKDINYDISFIDIECLRNKTFFITGATGLIGKMLVKVLIALNKEYNLNIKIIALVRQKDKAVNILKKNKEFYIEFIEGDICNLPKISSEINYIIHCASITQSKMFIEKPVEVLKTSLTGTMNILELAYSKNIESLVYLSSMEVYGFTSTEKLLRESDSGLINPLEVRNCYPESKRMAESMCISYFTEYAVPVKIVRLAQSFGFGVDPHDTRVFAQFSRCAYYHKDIELATSGQSKRMYIGTLDTASSILTVLTKGKSGEAYNIANKNTYCSIKEMADFISKEYNINTTINTSLQSSQYSPEHRLLLDVSKIEKLGWYPQEDLKCMFNRCIDSMFSITP